MNRALGYLFLGDEDASVRAYRRQQKLERLTQRLRQLGMATPEFWIDETPGERPQLAALLACIQPGDAFAACSLFELGSSFPDCLRVLSGLAACNVRMILLENGVDTGAAPD